MYELKFRMPAPLHKAITFAASRRGVAASSLVAMAVYEFLRERGELASNDVAVTKPDPSTLGVWLEEDD